MKRNRDHRDQQPSPSGKGRQVPDEAMEGGAAAAGAIVGGALGSAAAGPPGAAAGAIIGTSVGGAAAEEVEHAKRSDEPTHEDDNHRNQGLPDAR